MFRTPRKTFISGALKDPSLKLLLFPKRDFRQSFLRVEKEGCEACDFFVRFLNGSSLDLKDQLVERFHSKKGWGSIWKFIQADDE
jgi:hypothetical protein